MTRRRPDLEVWLYGSHLASLVDNAPGRPALRWEQAAAQRWPVNSTVLSVLLPITPSTPPNPARVRAFFAGLMPEGDARARLAFEAGVEESDIFGMMAAYGRDVAGAVVIRPLAAGPDTDDERLHPINDQGIRRRLERADSNDAPLGVVPGVTSLSLAGMQPKIALRLSPEGKWMECLNGAASTHIIKPGPRDSAPGADLIHNEAFCLHLARRLGLTTVTADIRTFDGRPALVVSRYDRRADADDVHRLHQEDCAQMLGLNTDDPARKFQYGRPLPPLRRIAEILDTEYAPRAPLLALSTFNVAVGNTDAHAKNISVLHDENGSLTLAPAYDIAPHRHYAFAGRRSAMDVNGGHDIDAITRQDLVDEGVSWGIKAPLARRTVQDTLEQFRNALAGPDAERPPGVPDDAFENMLSRVTNLLGGDPAAPSGSLFRSV